MHLPVSLMMKMKVKKEGGACGSNFDKAVARDLACPLFLRSFFFLHTSYPTSQLYLSSTTPHGELPRSKLLVAHKVLRRTSPMIFYIASKGQVSSCCGPVSPSNRALVSLLWHLESSHHLSKNIPLLYHSLLYPPDAETSSWRVLNTGLTSKITVGRYPEFRTSVQEVLTY
jgi:hypothetical protein